MSFELASDEVKKWYCETYPNEARKSGAGREEVRAWYCEKYPESARKLFPEMFRNKGAKRTVPAPAPANFAEPVTTAKPATPPGTSRGTVQLAEKMAAKVLDFLTHDKGLKPPVMTPAKPAGSPAFAEGKTPDNDPFALAAQMAHLL